MVKKEWKIFAIIAAVVAITLWVMSIGPSQKEDPGIKTIVAESIPISELVVEEYDKYMNVFSHMSFEEINSENNPAETIDFGFGLRLHKCWCYGLKVSSYDKKYDWGDQMINQIRIIQNPTTRDLIITDNEHYTAFYDAKEDLTFTQVVDGSSTLRRPEYSVYFWVNGDVDLVWSTDENGTKIVALREKWVPNPQENTPTTLDEMLEFQQKFSSWMLVKTAELGTYE